MPYLIDPSTGNLIYISDGKSTSVVDKGTDPSTSRNTPASTSGESSLKVESEIMDYMEGTVSLIPNPDFRAKRIYDLEGLGSVFNGNYYFKKVRHTIGATYEVEADVAKVDRVVLNFKQDTERNRPAVPPQAQPKPAQAQDNIDYINRWGTVTAVHGLAVRTGNVFTMIVNSNGYAIGGTQNSTRLCYLLYGRRIKVAYKKGDWYSVYYGSGQAWSYARYIKLD